MASSTSNSSMARTRSLRLPPLGTLKPIPPTATASSQPQGISNISLFLTNIRLLDLDLRKDWPDITTKTFSTKDAQQNQKKRIQSVEWALFQLFSLWDPEETHNKLQPFFPPLEPLQSLNLRAALFRCLDQAKKSGVLGRDTVLRKTMLDECKGERLEEVLAVFSNVVLKKVLREEGLGYGAIATDLAFENFSYSGERSVLSVLILAHKASLSKHLQEKNEARARYQDFSELLKLNERRITRRHEQLKEALKERGDYDKISAEEARKVQDKVQRNWSGNDQWLGAVLYGDSKVGEDGLLATGFDKVWKHVENGTISDVESKGRVGLLEQLDARVKDQENRLARWQDFGQTLSKNKTSSPVKDPALTGPKKIDLGFNRHENLQIGRSHGESIDTTSASLNEYNRMIENMKSEITAVRKPKVRGNRPRQSLTLQKSSLLNSPRPDASHVTLEDEDWSSATASDNDQPSPGFTSLASKSISRTPPSEPETSIPATVTPEDKPRQAISMPIRMKEVEAPRGSMLPPPKERSPSPPSEPETSLPAVTAQEEESRESLGTRRVEASRGSMLPPPRKERSPSPLPPTRTPSPERPAKPTESDLADEILDSMAAASPSPKKPRHTLSLAERTRLSMSRNSHAQFSSEDDFEPPRLSIKPRTSMVKTPAETPSIHEDLIERTRKSMAGFEAAQKKAQVERRKSVKDAKKKQRESSYFPKVEEEVVEPDMSAVELIEGDPDYDSVFKSRPKIATSPAVSPTRVWEDENEE